MFGADLYLLVMLVISGGFAGARISRLLVEWNFSRFHMSHRRFSVRGRSSTITPQLFNKYSTSIQHLFSNQSTTQPPPRRLFNKYSTIIQHVFNMYSTCSNSCPKSVIYSYSTKFNKIQHVFNKIQHVFNKIQLLLTVTNFIFTKKVTRNFSKV